MELFSKVLLGALAVFVLWRFLPGVQRAMKDAPRGTSADWMGLLLPIGAVVAFVALMILMLR